MGKHRDFLCLLQHPEGKSSAAGGGDEFVERARQAEVAAFFWDEGNVG